MNVELSFVLVGTTHTGNIGAAARAMKTMGYSSLRLVSSCSHRTDEAKARASGADDVLRNAACFDSLSDAVADCHAVIGTSARPRNLSVPMLSSRDLAATLSELSATASANAPATDAAREPLRVALVFGRERSGLNNEELDRCTHLVQIPVNADFSSLNLGSAVQVLAYESAAGQVSVRQTTDSQAESLDAKPCNSASMERFFEHLNRVILATGFLDPGNPRLLQRRLRQYFERNRPSDSEMNILRGILTSVEKPMPSQHDNSPPPEQRR